MTLNKLNDQNNDNDLQDIQINEIQYDTVVWANMKPDTFLLVNFLGGIQNKTKFKYLCVFGVKFR